MALVVCTPNQALVAFALLQVNVIWLVGFALVQPAADGAVKVANVGPVGTGAALGDGLGDGLSEGVSLGDGDGDGLSLGLAEGLKLGFDAGSLPVPRANNNVNSTTTAMSSRPPRIDKTMTSVRDRPPGSEGGPPAGGSGGSGGWLNRTVGASAARWSKDSVGLSWLMACLSLVWCPAGR